MEVELKFQVPQERRAALRRELMSAATSTIRLRATYFDTPGHSLAAARIALRLRREGTRWVQTLKGQGDGIAARIEHEVVLPAQRGTPAVDVARHSGTDAGAVLGRVLAGADPHALVTQFGTDVQRTTRRVRHAGAVIELAYDRGALIGPDGQRHPIDELEFELVSGPPAALASLAARWAGKHGLWWDCRTKSERGFRLATGGRAVAATRARRDGARAWPDASAAWRGALTETLAHALPNAAELADGAGGPEHVHQLRVALRRLRSVLRECAGFGPDPQAATELEAAWREPFGALGGARDADVLHASIRPALDAVAAPSLPWPPAGSGSGDTAAVVRGCAFNTLALRTLALAWAAEPALPVPWPQAAHLMLDRAWKRARRDAQAFEQADIERQHRLRKRLKRLRYVLELVPTSGPGRVTKAWQAALARCLERLGELNDLYTAEAWMRGQVAAHPEAWFAIGWLASESARQRRRAAKALDRLRRLPRPWPGP